MTKPDPAQVVGGLLLCAVLGLLSAELLNALAASPCPGGPNCYPWGAEGPVAGIWSYESKSNYLIRGFAQLALIAGAGLFLIWRAGRDRALSRLERTGSIAALGTAVLLSFV
ncbi:MAG TPA: hypothetical protein VEX35_12690 [Allosphingosinicella sp.]|nr:hypothetical protein [Allosphingosinicella sp.]